MNRAAKLQWWNSSQPAQHAKYDWNYSPLDDRGLIELLMKMILRQRAVTGRNIISTALATQPEKSTTSWSFSLALCFSEKLRGGVWSATKKRNELLAPSTKIALFTITIGTNILRAPCFDCHQAISLGLRNSRNPWLCGCVCLWSLHGDEMQRARKKWSFTFHQCLIDKVCWKEKILLC